ncbi:unnamed protein product [Bursaphelenchus okinawaensis]|uniref:Rubicon Homology domain-containing protein n=1 Tax=Bursaphelenchus okinawaensis TaxID=465554 RepID=A0A811LGI4_9BILA|nr:unnamed protein product [Bursaphelenchus okinawaensis]CAG9123432.1 unnamed protein product [Bursaphelenchus okinawaensis]
MQAAQSWAQNARILLDQKERKTKEISEIKTKKDFDESTAMSECTQIRPRTRSLSLLCEKKRNKPPSDEGWEYVDAIEATQELGDVSFFESNAGYRTENVHLYLSDMYIMCSERERWRRFTQNIDFTKDPGAITHKEHSQSLVDMNETELTVQNDSSVHNDQPCTSSTLLDVQDKNDEYLDESKRKISSDGRKRMDKDSDEVVNALVDYYEDRKRVKPEDEDWVNMIKNGNGPSELLDMAKYMPLPPDEAIGSRTDLRGAPVWRPLKRKFIYDLEEVRDFQTMLKDQNNCCEGCGRKMDKLYERRARVCFYYNKIFCQCCHRGAKARIPARILHQWNFKEYPVCDVAESFLHENESIPVYDVFAIEPRLTLKIKNLGKVRRIRLVISHLWQFIQLCPRSTEIETRNGILRTMFESIPPRYRELEKVSIYSIIDFERIENGNLIEILEPLEKRGIEHVLSCLICQQRGFLCQVCMQPKDIIFPFQIDKISRCEGCGSLSHKKCYHKWLKKYTSWRCGRCERLRKKRFRLSHQNGDSSNSD